MTSASESIALVCATHNRLSAIEATIANKLGIRGVTQLIFVLDGCSDGSASYLREQMKRDDRIVVIERARAGVQEAKNTGIQNAQTEWLLFLDDDDFAPPDYCEILLQEARTSGADIAGAPWLNCDGKEPENEILTARDAAVDRATLRTRVDVFTSRGRYSPYLPSGALVRANVARRIGFDQGYRGNAWREETDFYLRALASGAAIWRSSSTCTWSLGRFSGGHSRSRIAYEYWVLRNEARFLRRHRRHFAVTESDWRGWVVEWCLFGLSRMWNILVAKGRSLWVRPESA